MRLQSLVFSQVRLDNGGRIQACSEWKCASAVGAQAQSCSTDARYGLVLSNEASLGAWELVRTVANLT